MEITLTERASLAIKKIIEEEGMPSNSRLRVKVVGGGCSGFAYDMAFDEVQDGETVRPATTEDPKQELDRLYQIDGVNLVVDEMSLMYMLGTEIDYVEELAATGFKFNNPQSSSCACGSSFSV